MSKFVENSGDYPAPSSLGSGTPDATKVLLGDGTWGSPPAGSVLRDRSIWVDLDNGNDSTGTRGVFSKPFLTVAAALTAASSGDIVYLGPGTHTLAGGITIPTNVKVVGTGIGSTTISLPSSAISADTVAVAMPNSASSLEQVRIIAQTSNSFSLTGIKISNAGSLGNKLVNVAAVVTHTYAGANAVNAYGIHIDCNPGTEGTPQILDSLGYAAASGANVSARGLIRNTTSGGTFTTHSSWFFASGGLTPMAVEMNIASATLALIGCTCNGGTADVSQTAGTLVLTGTRLMNNTCNSKPFTNGGPRSFLVFGIQGTVASNATRYMPPGAGVSSTPEIKVNMPNPCILMNMRVRMSTGPASSKTVTFTVRKEAADAALTISAGAGVVEASDMTHVVTYAQGEDLSVKLVTDTNNNAVDPVVTLEVY